MMSTNRERGNSDVQISDGAVAHLPTPVSVAVVKSANAKREEDTLRAFAGSSPPPTEPAGILLTAAPAIHRFAAAALSSALNFVLAAPPDLTALARSDAQMQSVRPLVA